MPRRLPLYRQLTLDGSDRFFRRVREECISTYGRVDRVTGAFTIWMKEPKVEGAKWRKSFELKSLPATEPREEVERWCDALGCPPPWVPRAKRKAWRAAWRKRNGVPERKPRLERDRQRRVVSIGSIGRDIEDIPDDSDSFAHDPEFRPPSARRRRLQPAKRADDGAVPAPCPGPAGPRTQRL